MIASIDHQRYGDWMLTSIRALWLLALLTLLITAACSEDSMPVEGQPAAASTSTTGSLNASTTATTTAVVSPDRNVLLLEQLSRREADPAWGNYSDDEKIALAQALCDLADTYPSASEFAIGLWRDRDTGLPIGPEMAGNLSAAVSIAEYCSTANQQTVIDEFAVEVLHPLFGMRTFCDATDLGTESEELYGITAFYVCPDDTALDSLAEVETPRGRALITFEGAMNLCVDVDSFSYLYGETWVAPLRAAASGIDDDYRATLAEAVEGTWNTVECDAFLAVIGAADLGGAVMADLGYREASYDELRDLLNE